MLDVKRRVIDEREDPHVVAGEYGVSMAELFTAFAYYYEHREEFEAREQARTSRRARRGSADCRARFPDEFDR